MDTYVDTTPFIWTLIRNVVTMPYDDLKETAEFVKVYQLIEDDDDDKIYFVRIEDDTISSSDLNDLFEKILKYLQIKSNDESFRPFGTQDDRRSSYREMFIVFQKAMIIFSTHGQTDELSSILQTIEIGNKT